QERARRGFLLIDEADAICRIVTSAFETEGGCTRVIPAGEYRRQSPVVHSLDFVAETDDPLKAIRAFLHHTSPRQLLHRARSRIAIALPCGRVATLSVAPARDFAGLLLFRTGHPRHVRALVSHAAQKGLRLHSNGLQTLSGTDIEVCTEKELYAKLDLPFIPPELREEEVWVERAAQHALPELVEFDDLRGDLHVHSSGNDMQSTADRHALGELSNAGLRYVTLFEGPMETKMNVHNVRAWRQVGIESPIQLLRGVELEIDLDGRLIPDPTLLGSFDVLSATLSGGLHLPAEVQTQRLRTALRHPQLDVLAHPHCQLRDINRYVAFHEDSVFQLAAQAGIAIEISGAPDQLDLAGDACRRLRLYGGKVALGSRGNLQHATRNLTWALGQARRGLLGRDDIWNCSQADELPLHRG
ncbi:MAG: hypothetical protein ACO3JL_17515, partial [Myxococcota bacterium]